MKRRESWFAGSLSVENMGVSGKVRRCENLLGSMGRLTPNIGLMIMGSIVGIEALGSPCKNREYIAYVP